MTTNYSEKRLNFMSHEMKRLEEERHNSHRSNTENFVNYSFITD